MNRTLRAALSHVTSCNEICCGSVCAWGEKFENRRERERERWEGYMKSRFKEEIKG
jgi:hypothetical protein